MGNPEFEKSREERKRVEIRETLTLRADAASTVQQI